MDNIEIVMFKEINDYSEKFYGLTIRQWLFSILVGITVIPLYILLPRYTPINEDIASYLVILIGGSISFLGFAKIHNLNAEHILPYWYRHYMKFAKPIKYISEKEFEEMQDKKKKKVKAIKASETANNEEKTVSVPHEEETTSTDKENEAPIPVSPLEPTKKMSRKQRKLEKKYEKAKKKYGYLLDEKEDTNTDKKALAVPNEHEKEEVKHTEQEPVKVKKAEQAESQQELPVEQKMANMASTEHEDKAQEEKTDISSILSLSDEQKEILLKILSNGK